MYIYCIREWIWWGELHLLSVDIFSTYMVILLAPEVMCRQPHTFAVDYFALGVLAYEFMLGRVIYFYL